MENEFAEITKGHFICTCGHTQPDPRTSDHEAGEDFWFWLCPACACGYLCDVRYDLPEIWDCFTAYPPDDWRDTLHRWARHLRFALRQIARGKVPHWEPPF